MSHTNQDQEAAVRYISQTTPDQYDILVDDDVWIRVLKDISNAVSLTLEINHTDTQEFWDFYKSLSTERIVDLLVELHKCVTTAHGLGFPLVIGDTITGGGHVPFLIKGRSVQLDKDGCHIYYTVALSKFTL